MRFCHGWLVLVLAAVSSAALAEPQVWLVLVGPLPCSRAELERAVSVRVEAPLNEPVTLTSSTEADRVRITCRGRTQEVEVGGLQGPDAARALALVIAYLVEPDALPLALPASSQQSARSPRAISVRASGMFGVGMWSTTAWAWAPSLDVTLSRGIWRAGTRATWWRAPPPAPNPLAVRYDAWPLRAHFGAALGRFEPSLSAVALPYRLAGAVARSATAWGAGVELRYVLPLGARIFLLAALGGDWIAHRVSVALLNEIIFSSPRFAAHADLGLGWRVGT